MYLGVAVLLNLVVILLLLLVYCSATKMSGPVWPSLTSISPTNEYSYLTRPTLDTGPPTLLLLHSTRPEWSGKKSIILARIEAA